jgi:predicted HicB family RNase H-like nuclease
MSRKHYLHQTMEASKDENKKDSHLHIRVNANDKRALKSEAKKQGMSLSRYVLNQAKRKQI